MAIKPEKQVLGLSRKEVIAKFEDLKAQDQKARDAARNTTSPEARQATVDASRTLSDFMVQNPFLFPKSRTSKFSNQAGRRQYNERPENIRLGRRA